MDVEGTNARKTKVMLVEQTGHSR